MPLSAKWTEEERLEKRREYSRRYRERHPERMAAFTKAWRAKNPDYGREWAEANREALRKYNAEWHVANRDRRREMARARYAANPEKYRAYALSYLARKAGAAVGEIDYGRIIARDGDICGICGKKVRPKDRSFDHIHPLSRGGAHSEDNLQVSHLACNKRKQARVNECVDVQMRIS